MFSRFKNIFAKRPGPTRVMPPLPPPPPEYDLAVSMWSDVGCHRTVNEDCGRYVKPGDTALVARKGVLAFVADGMGGHAAGDLASRIVAEEVGRAYYAHDGSPHDALREAFIQANRTIFQRAQDEEEYRGMGTTCTALVLRGNDAFSAHVGDSRLYLIRDGAIERRSEDHSLVYEMVKQGLITEEEARDHEDRNVITRALGLHPDIDVATWDAPLAVRPDDRFLLCSDGLYDLVADDEILEIVTTDLPYIAGERLVALAKERGGHDNITVGVLWLKPLTTTPASPERETREIEIAL